MSTTGIRSGNKIANDTTSVCVPTSERSLVTLQDLLNLLNDNPPAGYAMLRTTAGKFSEFMNLPLDQIGIESIDAERDEFRDYLRHAKYAKDSVRSYSNYALILIKTAQTLGWSPNSVSIPEEWSFIAAESKRRGGTKLVKHLVRIGRSPATVAEEDLQNWLETQVRRGLSYSTATIYCGEIRRLLVKAGLGAQLAPNRIAKKRIGIPIDEFPEPLRSEVNEILRHKQGRFSRARSGKSPIRPATLVKFKSSFALLYGFAFSILRIHSITTLSELIREDILDRYVEWALDDHKIKSASVQHVITTFSATVCKHPKYADIDFGWLKKLIADLPEEFDDEIRRKKEKKYLPYEALASIPKAIRDSRSRLTKSTPREVAVLVRNELLTSWMTKLPWRQANLRNMRLSGESPNLFKAPFPKFTSMSKPEWLTEAEKSDPNIEVWQIHFSRNETKTKHEVDAVLPLSLVPLLEDYLSNHRPCLLKGNDPGTLFVTVYGKRLVQHAMTDLVAELTLRYGGRIVTPHLFRDIFAFMYLDKFPEDYLTLSKLLWHRNINTTIRIYGRRFNESAAMCRMEKLLGL